MSTPQPRPQDGRGSHLLGTLLACALGTLGGPAAGSDLMTAGLPDDLTALSLDDLLAVEITSVSKHAERLSHAAAAVYVVTGEEMLRIGARSIPEALRLVPGLQVVRTNANGYKVSARGFDSSGDKLLVLVDGRSVYTPLTSAVFWDVLDTYFADIDRIEVIRGPGATVWGANAVNGVINIVTHSASETHGGHVRGGASEEHVHGGARYGLGIGSAGHLRFYAKAFETQDASKANGQEAEDGQRHAQAGFRSDFDWGAGQQLMLSGDYYDGRTRALSPPPVMPIHNELSGGNLNSHWSWKVNEQHALSANFSYDHYQRLQPGTFEETRDTFDLALQYDLAVTPAATMTYGLGYRASNDETGGPPQAIIFLPQERNSETLSGFLQNQVRFFDGRVTWTIGSKFEHNDFSGFEVQPGTRLGWQVGAGWLTWASVARAVRTPNRLDHDIAIFCSATISPLFGNCPVGSTIPIGSRDFESEKLLAWEWGLRYIGSPRWSLDLATFYNDYSDLRSTEGALSTLRFENNLEGRGAGFEISSIWRPVSQLDVRAWYAFLDLQVERSGGADANTPGNIEGSSARHKAGLGATWQPHPAWTLSTFARYVGKLERTATPSATSGPVDVPDYTELQLRAAWRPWTFLEFAVIGANLLDRQHPEFGTTSARSELERSVMLEAIWQW